MPVEAGSTATPLSTGVFQLDGTSEEGWTATLLDADVIAQALDAGDLDVLRPVFA